MFCSNLAIAAIDYEMAQSLKCSRLFSYYERKYKIPKDTLHSISLQETGKTHSLHKKSIVWPWAINSEGQSFYFDNKAEAIAFIRSELKKGKRSIDVGCMQVNMKHHGHNFQSIEHALEPRINIEFGAKFLSQKFDQLGNWHQAIAHYHSATPKFGEKYSKSVFKIANNLDQNKKDIVRFYIDQRNNQRRAQKSRIN